jgi:hypothetical protein
MPSGTDLPDQAFLDVWRQALLDNARSVQLGEQSYAVRKTPGKRLRQVDFDVDGVNFRGLEQNPYTKSRWAELARKGAKVMQFLQSGKYVAAVADGKVTHYSSPAKTS